MPKAYFNDRIACDFAFIAVVGDEPQILDWMRCDV